MVLSCSLRDFLSPPGMEIRLGLCKRIFYFSFFPLLGLFFFFFHVPCPKWPFRKSNLYFFFSPWQRLFFFFAICCITDICPMDFCSREFWKGFFFSVGRKKIIVSSYVYPFDPDQQNFSFEMKTFHWTLAPVYNIKMDLYQLSDWWVLQRSSCDLSSLCWLNHCMKTLLHSAKFSHQSIRDRYCRLCLRACDWYARLGYS